MTTPFLAGDTAGFEGLRLQAYADPKSQLGIELAKPMKERKPGWQALSGAPWSIGYGHTGPEVRKGLIWTLGKARSVLLSDLAAACAELDQRIPWWRKMNDVRQDVLAGVRFNLGWPRLSGFHNTLAALQASEWEDAARELLDSDAARELPARYGWYAERLRTGLRP